MKTKLLVNAIFIALMILCFKAFAASTFTTHYNLAMPAAGDTGWADALNSNAVEIDEQMFINQTTITNHITDTVGAHEASAISSEVGGLVCFDSETVQDFLECLDLNLGSLTTGAVVTLNTDQTITGQKTFTAVTLLDGGFSAGGTATFSGLSTGIAHLDSGGVLSSSLLVNADVDAAAAIAYSKLSLSNSILNADINASAGIAYSKLSLSNSILNADINASAGIAYSKLALTGSIVNADIGAAAAIAGSKINPDFGSQTLIGGALKATSSAGILFEASSGTDVATFGAGGGAQAVFAGALQTDTSLIIQDPGAGTNAITLTAPSGLSASYALTLPNDDGIANQVLGTNGSGTLSWVDATSGYSQNSDTTLTASDTIAIGTGNADRLQHWRIKSNSGAVTLSSTPFGTSNPQDRTAICLIGVSDTDTVTIAVNDAADGVVGNGDVTLGLYESACFRYLSTEDRYVIESRSN